MPLCVTAWVGISRLIHGHFGAHITVTLGRRLGKNHGHFGAQTYNKSYSFTGSCRLSSVENRAKRSAPQKARTHRLEGGAAPFASLTPGIFEEENGQFSALWISLCRSDKTRLLRTWSELKKPGKTVTSRCVISYQSRPKPLGSSTPCSCSTRSRKASTSSRRSAVGLSARLAGRLSFHS